MINFRHIIVCIHLHANLGILRCTINSTPWITIPKIPFLQVYLSHNSLMLFLHLFSNGSLFFLYILHNFWSFFICFVSLHFVLPLSHLLESIFCLFLNFTKLKTNVCSFSALSKDHCLLKDFQHFVCQVFFFSLLYNFCSFQLLVGTVTTF